MMFSSNCKCYNKFHINVKLMATSVSIMPESVTKIAADRVKPYPYYLYNSGRNCLNNGHTHVKIVGCLFRNRTLFIYSFLTYKHVSNLLISGLQTAENNTLSAQGSEETWKRKHISQMFAQSENVPNF